MKIFDDIWDSLKGNAKSRINEPIFGALTRGQGQPNINADIIKTTGLPLPPLLEKAKVDALTSICDQLKSQLNQAQQTQVNLTDALVELAV